MKQKRSEYFVVKVTESEKTRFQELAAKNKMTVSAYVRMLICQELRKEK